MAAMDSEFTRFQQHEGWERVADKYDSVWSKSTQQFIPYLLGAAGVFPGMQTLNVRRSELKAQRRMPKRY
jgi:hypothetical protein